MNSKSMTERTTAMPSSLPCPHRTASVLPLASAAAIRAGYGFRSVNPRGSEARRSASISRNVPPSSKMLT